MREKKLLIGFGALLILIVSIGIVGIGQINSLSHTIQKLGQHHLPKERMILEMKVNNTLYVMAVRNYIFWRTSKYLQAVSSGSDIKSIQSYASSFSDNLSTYYSLGDSKEEKMSVRMLEAAAKEFESIGEKLIVLADANPQDKEQINKLFVNFENRAYKIDDILVETLSRNNLRSAKEQLKLTSVKKDAAISILIATLLMSCILGIFIAYFVYRSLKDGRKRREALVQRMISLEEEERKNLSRQIHDQLGQDLGALKIYLELMGENIDSSDMEQNARLHKSRTILTNLIEKGHNISELLRPPELDDLGLVESIEHLIGEHKDITGNNYNYYKPDSEIKLSPEHSLTLYRITQEALANIIKHSYANNVEIFLKKQDNFIKLVIIDDGVGFDYDDYLRTRPTRRKEDKLKLGLRGFQERIELLGGRLSVESNPGSGTKLEIDLPI